MTVVLATAQNPAEELFRYCCRLGIVTNTRTHPPVHTVAEAEDYWSDIGGIHTKNLFLKDAKDHLWLVSAPIARVIQFKHLPQQIGAKRLSFGRSDLLQEVLGVSPGAVSPFALLNDTARRVTLVLDAWMMEQPLLNFHPLVNTATTSIRPADLLTFLHSCGHEPRLVRLDAVTTSEVGS